MDLTKFFKYHYILKKTINTKLIKIALIKAIQKINLSTLNLDLNFFKAKLYIPTPNTPPNVLLIISVISNTPIDNSYCKNSIAKLKKNTKRILFKLFLRNKIDLIIIPKGKKNEYI
ncbi:Uncharacterised protein [Peptoniphilus harei]|uniref:Uncharacterized protein n=1 Tax=Peptoniphilus harei TaxID=54005 RepID=A0A2X1Y2C9_9FIRM|nr:Uncharacterised protein [Peptoniphilus harei]